MLVIVYYGQGTFKHSTYRETNAASTSEIEGYSAICCDLRYFLW